LSYDLLFEVLRLVLIVSLIIVQISTAFAESIGKQFNKGMLRALELDYKGNQQSFIDRKRDSTGLVKKFIGLMGHTKLTDI